MRAHEPPLRIRLGDGVWQGWVEFQMGRRSRFVLLERISPVSMIFAAEYVRLDHLRDTGPLVLPEPAVFSRYEGDA